MCLLKDISWCHQCADDFQLPYANGKYFPAADRSRVQAKEHRNIMQVCPHILNGIDEECCELTCRYGDISSSLVCMAQFVMAFQCVWEAKDGMCVAAMRGISGNAQEASKEGGMGTRN